jgi:hypothetical protein
LVVRKPGRAVRKWEEGEEARSMKLERTAGGLYRPPTTCVINRIGLDEGANGEATEKV